MKKIVRRNHIQENFRQNLREQFTAGDVADVFIPGVSAFKNFRKGDIGAGLLDAGLDIASLAAGALTGGVGYAGARAAVSAAKAGTKVISKTGAKLAKKKIVPKARSVPNTGYGPWGRTVGGKGKAPKKNTSTGKAAGVAGGVAAAAGGLLGAASGGTGGPSSILAKERPQTGFGNRYQGIDPFRSGEMRASAGYYDTPVGRRQLYKGAGGGLVAPPSSMYEETVISQLQEMVKSSISKKEVNDILVTNDMARNIVNLYEALNTDNKKLLEDRIQSKDGFFETLDFSIRN